MNNSLELLPVKIYSDETNELAEEVARVIAEDIERNNALGKHTVLALDTGNAVLDVYRELVALHEANKIDFANTMVFNLYEYYEISKGHPFSVRKFIEDGLLNKINVKQENIHLLDSTIPEAKMDEYTKKYDDTIKALGGIDILLLGVGNMGHMGLNGPASPPDAKTRLVNLDKWALISSIPDFSEFKFIPKRGLTMGIPNIFDSKRVLFIATGDHKAEVVRKTVEGSVTSDLLVTHFQRNPNATVYIDEAASSRLTQTLTPWFVCSVDWTLVSNRARAVCHLSEELQKPISELETRDFLQYSLQTLIKQYPIEVLTKEVMSMLGKKIVSQSELPRGKKVIIFSPHPDDDIISMGGTLLKLVANGNSVHCIYMTPGTNAVFDHEVEKFLFNRVNFARSINDEDMLRKDQEHYDRVMKFLKEKSESKFGMKDTDDVKLIKKLIRQGEGVSTCSFCNVDGYEFLDPPLYRSGKSKKNPLSKEDIDIVWDVLVRHQPDLVYAAGDLTDPNGTHRLCLRAITKAFEKYGEGSKPELWLYRGAWQEFHPVDADIFVTMTKDDLLQKRDGIFRHQSQKDRPPQPGHSGKEFWQSSEERNLGTAKRLVGYGFEGLYAIEGFKLYRKECVLTEVINATLSLFLVH
eukprot:TRINITY_DN478_c0_g1_i10.p1 TRINITY_DN478_c0_g1~~TRINITY_DN478_c0_g1_i10.p1  ORF type:complete len:637 (-),score=171.21 TRINITY_DN478_c0_g1_i10:128-2038(-)